MLTRMLQLLPAVCKYMPKSFQNALFGISDHKRNSINWFHDLLALGSLASKAVLRWWQNAACDIVDNLVQSGSLSEALNAIISDLLKPGTSSILFIDYHVILICWSGPYRDFMYLANLVYRA